MGDFLTRVELHGGDSKDYDKLHAAMESAGFKRSILADDRKVYPLPTAEYLIQGNYDRATLLQHTKNLANGIKKNWVLVVEYSGATWNYN